MSGNNKKGHGSEVDSLQDAHLRRTCAFKPLSRLGFTNKIAVATGKAVLLLHVG